MVRRFFVFFLIAFFTFSAFSAKPASAEQNVQVQQSESWYNGGFTGVNNAINDTTTNNSVSKEPLDIYSISTTFPIGIISAISGFHGQTTVTAWLNDYKKSALGQTSNMMAAMYVQPPASTTEYLADVFNRTGVIPQAYAQGITYSRLIPILPMWKAFRDIAYIMLTLIMLFAGLMIMMRQKINPQTVASIENTIPSVIVTLVLITFSFPIASLILDFMYIIIAAGIQVIGSTISDPNLGDAIKAYSSGTAINLFDKAVFAPIAPFMPSFVQSGTGAAVGAVGAVGIGAIVGLGVLAPLLAIIGGMIGAVAASGGDLMTTLSPLLVLIIFVVLFFGVFKIFFMLLMNYIQIVVFIIFAPFILMMNAVPGKSTWSYWWKNIAGNAISFVVVSIMLYLGYAINLRVVETKGFWVAPFIGLSNGDAASRMVVGLISLGIVLMIPQFVQMAKGIFNVKPFANVGPGMIVAPLTQSLGQISGLGQQFRAWDQTARESGGIVGKVLRGVGLGKKN
ncbi:MAG: hypothetical protein WC775_04630 [Patescibacteria group bacterium]